MIASFKRKSGEFKEGEEIPEEIKKDLDNIDKKKKKIIKKKEESGEEKEEEEIEKSEQEEKKPKLKKIIK